MLAPIETATTNEADRLPPLSGRYGIIRWTDSEYSPGGVHNHGARRYHSLYSTPGQRVDMKPTDRKRFMPPSGVRVRLQGYPGRPRRRGSPVRSLGVVVLIVTVLGVTAVFRHLPRGAGEGKPAAAHTGVSDASQPQQRVSAPLSAPSPAVSPEPAVHVQPAAPAISPSSPPPAPVSGVTSALLNAAMFRSLHRRARASSAGRRFRI